MLQRKFGVKGICIELHDQLRGGKMDTSKLEKAWKDESTGKAIPMFCVAKPLYISSNY